MILYYDNPLHGGYDGQVVYCIEPAIDRVIGETMPGFG
jgi:hypothetical protein